MEFPQVLTSCVYINAEVKLLDQFWKLRIQCLLSVLLLAGLERFDSPIEFVLQKKLSAIKDTFFGVLVKIA